MLVLRDRATGKKVKLQITGMFRPLNAADPYWGLDLVSTTGVSEQVGFISYGPFVVARQALASGQIPIGGATWLYGLGTTKLTAAQLNPLASRVGRALGQISRSADLGGLQVVSGLPAVLGVVSTKLVVARSLLLVAELELLLLAGAALTLTARTLAGQREEESAIFGSGKGRPQAAGGDGARRGTDRDHDRRRRGGAARQQAGQRTGQDRSAEVGRAEDHRHRGR